MSESPECQCIYVQVMSDKHPRSGRVEYRVKSCPMCRAEDEALIGDSTGVAVFGCRAARYPRMH